MVMVVLALISIVNTYSFILIGLYILRLNRGEKLNHLAAGVYFSFAIWSLFYTFLYIAPTAEYAMLWHRLGAIGWGMFVPLATRFFIVLADRSRTKVGIKDVLVYLLPVAIVLNALFDPSGTAVARGFERGQGQISGWDVYIQPEICLVLAVFGAYNRIFCLCPEEDVQLGRGQ